ncbi:MAG: 1,4-dihydroxy-2-naphthoate polyprenyltransferase [Caldibacillus sp.]
MPLATFLKLVEIKTKLCSLLPFFIGILFAYYQYGKLNIQNTLIFFFAMIIFDMTTTAINNYMDYKKAKSETYRREENIIGQKNIPERIVVTIILTMLTLASILGIILVLRTNLILLLIGMVCFGIGIFYTFGPIPFSRMPLGEILSGLTMGFGIVFLAVYVNGFDRGIVSLTWQSRYIAIEMDLIALFEILLISLPCIFTIANVMLANNICDLEYDIKNQRFTLPYYLGKRRAILLFNILYIASFAAIIVAVFFNLFPKIMLLSLLISIPVYKHMTIFNNEQTKTKTFDVSVKNLVLIDGTIVSMLLLAIIL